MMKLPPLQSHHRSFFYFHNMKHSLFGSIVCAFACNILLAACHSDETSFSVIPSSDPTIVWQRPHTYFLGYKGAIRSVEEYKQFTEDGENYDTDIIRTEFDAYGQITHYNPTGTPSARWIGMATESYYYEYDIHHRINKAETKMQEETISTYTFHYGSDTRFYPLPCTIGEIPLLMVQGLIDVQSNDENFKVTITNDNITYTTTENTWRGTLVHQNTFNYAPNSLFPKECIKTTSRNDEVLSKEITSYTFDEEGWLTATDIKIYENNELIEKQQVHYHPSIPLSPQHKQVISADGITSNWEYEYDENDWQSRVLYQQEETEERELYQYHKIDKQGNWYEGEFTWNERVNPAHWLQTFRIYRNITY